MKRTLVALLGLALVLPFSTAHAQQAPRYRGYLVCTAKKAAEPATTCGRNKKKTAVFLSKDRDAVYKVCVKFPGKKKRLCASHQPADEGVKSGVSVTASDPGTLKATWYVDGDKVATWTMEIT